MPKLVKIKGNIGPNTKVCLTHVPYGQGSFSSDSSTSPAKLYCIYFRKSNKLSDDAVMK